MKPSTPDTARRRSSPARRRPSRRLLGRWTSPSSTSLLPPRSPTSDLMPRNTLREPQAPY
eukprot:1272590-Prymnesium_polylepis.1